MTTKELLKTNIPRSIWILFVYVLYAIVGTLGTYLFKYSLNALTTKNLNSFIFWEILTTATELATALLLPIATVAFTRQIQDYLHEIRKNIMHYYYNGDDEKVSTMQNDLTSNLKILSTDFATPLITIFSGLLSIIFSIGILISMSWILIVTTAVLAVITLSLPKLLEKKMSQANAVVNQKNEYLLNAIAHWLGGLQELRRYNAFVRLNKKLKEASNQYVEANKNNILYRNLSDVINGLGNTIAQLGMVLIAAILFFNHTISFGDFGVASSFAFTIFGGIWDITDSLTKIKSTKTLREETAKLRQAKSVTTPTPAYGVTATNLVAKYDNGETISYPDFTIKPGQKVLLTGDSGTGKSTLFKLLLNKLSPKNGQIVFLDKDGKSIKTPAQVGNLPQDPVVFPASIQDNITMFNQKLKDQVKTAVDQVQLTSDLAKMPAGLDTQVNLKTENLSGGQRQKVVLARSLLHDQPFVLMDEVTSAIDQAGTEKILDNLLKTKKTILMIAHNFTPEMKAKFDQEIKLTAVRKEAAE